MTMGERYETTVPQQSLFLMNSPLVIEQARNIVGRSDFLAQSTSEGRIALLYELIYQRPPQPEEIKLGLQFLAQFPGADKTAAAWPQTFPVVTGQVRKRNQRDIFKAPVARAPLSGWAEYAHALLLSNEASFVN